MKSGLHPREEELIDCSLIREQMKEIIDLEVSYVYFFHHRKMVNTVLLTFFKKLKIHSCQRQLLHYSMKISCMDAKSGCNGSVLKNS